MARGAGRVRIDDAGGLEVIDPGVDAVPLLQSVDPGFRVRCAPLAGFTVPRLRTIRTLGCGLSSATLRSAPDRELWALHDALLRDRRSWRGTARPPSAEEGSLLELKIEIARRLLEDCRLCGRRCGVDRTRGERGVCGLGPDAVVAEHFVHVAEEPPINPSLVLNLAGCGLRCRYCQQGDLLAPARVTGAALEPGLWPDLDWTGARSLSFVGGNPDESLYAILRFLRAAPADWALPIVWNSHAYGAPDALKLLHGVVDAFLPDLKYGNDRCGFRLSAVTGYADAARASLTAMLAQRVPVIVRVLVLPGHSECCHLPVLDWLKALESPCIQVSVRGQYSPDYRITAADGPLARRVAPEEVESVRRHATGLGLRLVD